MIKNMINNIKLKRVINPNPLWWSRPIRFTQKLFGMEISHWNIDQEQHALAPPNDLALNVWMNKIAILCARITKNNASKHICAWITKNNASKHIGFTQNHITKTCSFACLNAYWYYCTSCETEHLFVVGSFGMTFPLKTWFTAFHRCCEQVLNHISCRKWFCFLGGALTKNRTLTKPSCQVRRLSKLKPACVICLYLFLHSATRCVPSLVEAWLICAHGCTFFALLLLPSPKPLGVALDRGMQSSGKWLKCHMQRQRCVIPYWL